MICPRCGKEYDTTVDCPYCSSNTITESYNNYSSYASSEITEKDLELFVGFKKSAYYLTKWDNMNMAASSVSWNWPAFFFSPIWMLYRKMYAYGFGLVGISILLNFLFKDYSIGIIISWAIKIAVGIFANRIYKEHVTRKIKEIKATSSDSEMCNRRIAYAGGVNIVIPIIVGILYALILLFIIAAVILVAANYSEFMY